VGVRELLRHCEDWWFDTTRGVQTTGNVRVPHPSEVVGEIRDSEMYVPVRASNAKAALRDLPMSDLSEYTFIDMGSGKGRVLFVAAEYSFKKIIGVEFSIALHEHAQRNIARYKSRKQRSGTIEAVLADAARYSFPAGKLVIYLFNPFGPDIMSRMLTNLEMSLHIDPRHVVLVLVWTEGGDLVAAVPGVREVMKTRRHHIYEIGQRP
jgi:SAM-dependent methyltransferase